MFDLMEKLKMPVLWACVVMMGGFGVWWLFADLFGAGGPKIEEVEVGSFEVPGCSKLTYTNLEFEQEAQKMLQVLNIFGRSRNADAAQLGQSLLRVTVRDELELAWAWLILREAARCSGILVTDEVALDNLKKMRMAENEWTVRDYRRKVGEETRATWRDLFAINRFRSAVDEAQPQATWDKIFDRYKSTYQDLRASFVFFDTQKAEVAIDPRNAPEDRAKLEKWLTENPVVRSQQRIPEELDARVLYARFKDEPTENLQKQWNDRWAPLVAELKIEPPSDEKLKARFETFKSAWDAPVRVALDQWLKEHAAESRPGDRPTEFDLVKERLRIEWLVTRLAEKAFEELSRADKPLGMEDAAAKYGLKLTEISRLDSLRIQQHPDFGSPRGAMAMLSGLREKSLKFGDLYAYRGDPTLASGPLEEVGSNVAIWKLTGYAPEREATLDDPGSVEKFVEEYRKKRRQDLAKEEAEAFKKAVDEKVAAAVASKVAELDAARVVAVDKQIADQKLDRSNAEDKPKILEIENAERARMDAAVDAEKAAVEPNMFQAVAAEKFVTVRDTGWIAKTSSRNATFAANEKLTTSEKAEQFFRKAQRRLALAGMKTGRMGAVETEPVWAVAAVPLLTEKRDPQPADLYKLSKMQLDQIKSQVTPPVQSATNWTYDNFKRPEWFNLNAPGVEKAIEAKRDADKERAEKKRLQDEQKKKRGRARAEKAAQDALQSRPLFAGEDW